MSRNSSLATLINQKPLTPRQARRIMNTSRSEAHQPASSRIPKNVRPTETAVLDAETQAESEKNKQRK